MQLVVPATKQKTIFVKEKCRSVQPQMQMKALDVDVSDGVTLSSTLDMKCEQGQLRLLKITALSLLHEGCHWIWLTCVIYTTGNGKKSICVPHICISMSI